MLVVKQILFLMAFVLSILWIHQSREMVMENIVTLSLQKQAIEAQHVQSHMERKEELKPPKELGS